jgi:hypothetical protein
MSESFRPELKAIPFLLLASTVLGCVSSCVLTWTGYGPETWIDPKTVHRDFDTPPVPFDGAKWKAGSARDRIGMAKQLEQGGTLIGKDSRELTALLGPPDETRSEYLNWQLANRDTGLFMYYDQLVVRLGADGKAIEAYYRIQD